MLDDLANQLSESLLAESKAEHADSIEIDGQFEFSTEGCKKTTEEIRKHLPERAGDVPREKRFPGWLWFDLGTPRRHAINLGQEFGTCDDLDNRPKMGPRESYDPMRASAWTACRMIVTNPVQRARAGRDKDHDHSGNCKRCLHRMGG